MQIIKLYVLGIFFLASFSPAIGQIDSHYRENQKKALAASSVAEYQSSLRFCDKVLIDEPNHPIINYLAARLNTQLGNEDVALEQLILATKSGYTTLLPFDKIHQLNDSAFDAIRGKKEFQDIINLLKQSEKPVHHSEFAFTLPDKDFLPEGIAYDPVEKMFYLGSETKKKIVKVDQQGNCTDFTQKGQTGLDLVLGIHVDPVRRVLWACSYEGNRNGVYKFDLSSGRLIKKYPNPLATDTGFNDLVIHSNGDVFISASTSSEIYIIPRSSDTLELFLRDNALISPNGITLSDDGNTIYVADVRVGIYKIDIKTKTCIRLSHESDFYPYGIDGLYYSNNRLYAVQICLNKITRFSLNKNATHLAKCDIIERNGPYLHKPTTGVIVDDYFYFIADTQGKGEKGIIIMKAPLK
ncbi:SMP-30/gluconolactonase/LRE family protein [bacterium]|nr:SMP-30/gluconolactonase/LRE family protein [bacterium]